MSIFLSKVLAGFVIGAGAIIPGLSGGILAVSMGLYQPTIEAITGFFKNVKKNFKFLLPLAIGGIVGFLLFMFLIDGLFAKYQTEIVTLFLGLVVGSVPMFLKEANEEGKFKRSNILYIIIGFAVAFTLVYLGFVSETAGEAATGRELTPLLSAVCGGIIMVGTVLPGVSTSFVLMNMGVYEKFMKVFTNFLRDPGHNIILALCAVAGIVIVAVPMLIIVKKVLQRYHRQSYFTLFGVLIATLVGCVMQEVRNNIGGIDFFRVVILIVLFAGGVAASYAMDRATKKLETRN